MKKIKSIIKKIIPDLLVMTLLGISILILTYPLVISARKYPKKPLPQTEFQDSARFKLIINDTVIATSNESWDRNGAYKRRIKVAYAGQTIDMNMTLLPGKEGEWEKMIVENPTFGTITAERRANRVDYVFKGENKHVNLPDVCFIYDDYGTIPESLMFRKYDKQKSGRQIFKRFRIPQTFPGDLINIEIEYLRTEKREVKGMERDFLIFNWKLMGENATYWLDEDFKVYMVEVPSQHAIGIREGFEEMIKPVVGDPLLSKPEFNVDKKNLMVPMRDGVKLSTDLYFPHSLKNKLPVILVRTPYKKDLQELTGNYYAKRGYIFAIQDVRGRFASEGTWEPFVNERKDGFDTIEWLAEQDWSNGRIGMIGGSYLGWVQLQAAVEKPPHLVTIIPNVTPPDPFFNIPYEYGSFWILASLWWAEVVESEATADISQKELSRINDRKYDQILNTLPVIDLDKKIFGKKNLYWREWIKHNVNDSYWERANYLDRLKDVDIPVFLQSGWFDSDGIGTKLSYLRLKNSKSRHIKLVLGPWEHTDTDSSTVRGHDVGKEATIDLQTMYLRWFDYWLKGIDNEIIDEPLVQMYVLNSNKWVKDDVYPLQETKFTKYYLSSEKGANTLDGDGILQGIIPAAKKQFDSYIYDPGYPTPAPDFRNREQGIQGYHKITRKRNDILIYQTKALAEPLSIVGPVSAVIYASSSAKDTDWFISFQAVQPNGEIIPLARGTIRARFRNSTQKPEFLRKDEVYEYNIDLWHTGITFKKGWKIKIEITSAYFPHFSRNLNTGGHNEMETHYIKANQRIYHSKEYPSYLLLPVVEIK